MKTTKRNKLNKLGFTLAGVLALNVASAQTLDQEQLAHNNGGTSVGSGQEVGQTFTAGLSGSLTGIDFYLTAGQGEYDFFTGNFGPVPNLLVSLRDGGPEGAVLSSLFVPAASTSAGLQSFSFSSPAQVVSGQTYAMVFGTDGPGYYGAYDSFTWGPTTGITRLTCILPAWPSIMGRARQPFPRIRTRTMCFGPTSPPGKAPPSPSQPPQC